MRGTTWHPWISLMKSNNAEHDSMPWRHAEFVNNCRQPFFILEEYIPLFSLTISFALSLRKLLSKCIKNRVVSKRSHETWVMSQTSNRAVSANVIIFCELPGNLDPGNHHPCLQQLICGSNGDCKHNYLPPIQGCFRHFLSLSTGVKRAAKQYK